MAGALAVRGSESLAWQGGAWRTTKGQRITERVPLPRPRKTERFARWIDNLRDVRGKNSPSGRPRPIEAGQTAALLAG
jgi:hypothetical protein